MRVSILMAILVGLAACNMTPIPDSGAEATGVGFGNPNRYLAEREARNAALEGQAVAGIDGAVSPEAVVGAPLSALGTDPGSPTQTGDAATLAAQTRAALGATAGQSGLSDEQNFEAVANRETIESDRQRLEQQREQFQVVAPTAVPDRASGGLARGRSAGRFRRSPPGRRSAPPRTRAGRAAARGRAGRGSRGRGAPRPPRAR